MCPSRSRIGLSLLIGFALLFVPCAISAISAPAQAAIVPAWTSGPQMGANLTQAVVVYDGEDLVYVIGGVNNMAYAPELDTTYSYSISSGAWTELARMPVGVRGAAGTFGDDGKIYVFAGANSSTVQNTQIYDPATDSWDTGTPTPAAVWEAKAATTSQGIFLVGGEGSGGAVNMYDPALDSWSPKAPMPSILISGALVSDGTLLYYFGGADNSYNAVATSYVYYPWDSWSTLDSMPVAVAATAGAMGTDGLIYVVGGGPQAFNIGAAVPTCYVYDLESGDWTTGPDLSLASKYLGVVATNDHRILALGGNGDDVYSRVESMTIMTSSVTLSSTSIGEGGSILVTLSYDFAFAKPTGYSGSAYFLSEDNVLYGSTSFSSPLGTAFAVEVTMPESAPAGQYTLVIPETFTIPYYERLPYFEAAITVLDVYSVQEQIDMLSANVTALQAQLVALESSTSSNLTSLQAQLTALQGQLTVTQAQLGALLTGFGAMAAGQAQAFAQMNATLIDLQDRLDQFQAQIDRVENKADTGGMLSIVILVLVIVVIALLAVMVMMARKKQTP